MNKPDPSIIKSLFELHRAGDYRTLLKRTHTLLETHARMNWYSTACQVRHTWNWKTLNRQSTVTGKRWQLNRISPSCITAWVSRISAVHRSNPQPKVFTMQSGMIRNSPKVGSTWVSFMKTGNDCRKLRVTIKRQRCSTRFITRPSVHLPRCCGNCACPTRLRNTLKKRWLLKKVTCRRTWA